jgi:hypothetical protein
VAPVNDDEVQDERRQLLIVETASKMKRELIAPCYELLGDVVKSAVEMKPSPVHSRGAKCSAAEPLALCLFLGCITAMRYLDFQSSARYRNCIFM